MAKRLNVAINFPGIPAALLQSFVSKQVKISEFNNRATPEEIDRLNPDIVIAYNPPEKLLAQDQCKWLLLPAAGVDHLDFEMLQKYQIKTINSHANATAVAEHAFALLLSVAKRLPKYDHEVRSLDQWPPTSHLNESNINLSGKTLGIAGYGAIGRHIDTLATAFGMEIVIIKQTAEYRNEYTLEEFTDIASNLDVLILALPLTTDTRGYFSKEKLDLLPSHAIIVNVARAGLIDEKAVYDKLLDHTLFGAAFDVWENDPLGRTDDGVKPIDLVKVPNLVISPYRAWVNIDSYAATAEFLGQTIEEIRKGLEVSGILDYSKGY